MAFQTGSVDKNGIARTPDGKVYVTLGTGSSFSGQLLAADGTAAAPSYSFSSETSTGWYRSGGSQIDVTLSGAQYSRFDIEGMQFKSTNALKFSSGSIGSASDAYLKRYAAKQLSITGDGTGATTNAGMVIGYSGLSGYGAMWSSSFAGATSDNMALMQGSAGETYVQAAASQAITFRVGGAAYWVMSATGAGYPAGSGGAVTQLTNKATGVTLSKVSGEITMNGAALAADTIVSFTLTNTAIAAADQLVVTHQSAGTSGAYTVNAFPAAGSAVISVRNNTAGSLSEAIVLKFSVIKGATS